MKRSNWNKIAKSEKENLREGNTYAFADMLLKVHPGFAKRMGFDFSKAVNSYRSYIEYDNGMFIFRADNGDKHFFDTEMKYLGCKTY